MTRESYVKQLIKLQNMSVKEFARSVEIPYTTLLGMLKNGLGGAAVDSVIKVCKGLDITVDDLNKVKDAQEPIAPFYVNCHEKQVVTQYRAKPEMQPAVDKILGIAEGVDDGQ